MPMLILCRKDASSASRDLKQLRTNYFLTILSVEPLLDEAINN